MKKLIYINFALYSTGNGGAGGMGGKGGILTLIDLRKSEDHSISTTDGINWNSFVAPNLINLMMIDKLFFF